MRQNKKILFVFSIVVALILLVMVAAWAFADDDTVSVVGNNPIADKDGNITYTITVTPPPTKTDTYYGLFAFNIRILFDPNIVSFQSASGATVGFYTINDGDTGVLHYAGGWAGGNTVPFVLSANFKVNLDEFNEGDPPPFELEVVRDGYPPGTVGISEIVNDSYKYEFISVDRLISITNGHITLPAIHTVTFDSQSGSAVASEEVADDDKVTKPADPIRSGYNFGNWYIDKDCADKDLYDFETPVTDSFTLYAKWIPIPVYTVEFNSQGGSVVNSQDITDGETVEEPDDPEKSGFYFGGWYTDASCLEEFLYVFDTPVFSDFTLFAKWSLIPVYTITFDSQGGSTVIYQIITDGNKVTEPENPTFIHHVFDGWYTDADCTDGNEYEFDTPVKNGFTLYANWIAITTFTVAFNSNGGSDVDNQIVDEGDKAFEPIPTKLGFIFGGWYEDVALEKKFNFNNFITADITLYAKWIDPKLSIVGNGPEVTPLIVNTENEITYTVTLIPGSKGITSYGFEIVYDTKLVALKNGDGDISLEGTEDVGDPFINPNYTANSIKVAFSSGRNFFTEVVIKITFLVSTGELTPGDPKSPFIIKDIGAGIGVGVGGVEPIDPADIDLEVNGYIMVPLPTYTIEATAGANGSIAPNGSVVVTEGDDQTFTFTPAAGYEVDTVTVDSVPVLTAPSYTFTSVASNHTINVTFKLIPPVHTVTFDSKGGSAIPDQLVDHDNEATEPTEPTKDGYAFAGWYTEEECTDVYDFETPVTDDLTLYAKWIKTYKVTFDCDGGTPEPPVQVVLEGEKANEPAALTKTDYTFGGWYTDGTFTVIYDFDTAVTGDIVIYAKWVTAAISHTVTFKDGDTTLYIRTVIDGGKVIKPYPNPTKTGYAFVNWYTDEDCTVLYDFDTLVTDDFTLYAKWQINTYT
ncbi:MAG: InlB B-repeat-containing protein, partial [Clostridiales bacterium]|nr:InlB B-repeat-containing protein [Clostridiales bacterium]